MVGGVFAFVFLGGGGVYVYMCVCMHACMCVCVHVHACIHYKKKERWEGERRKVKYVASVDTEPNAGSQAWSCLVWTLSLILILI